MRRVIPFDGERLQRAAGVRLGVSDLLALTNLATIFNERFREPAPPEFMLTDCNPNERIARRAFVGAVWETWNDCKRRRQRRKRDERRRNNKRPAYDAQEKQCLNLVRELLVAVGEQPPSDATLRHDLEFIKTGRERSH